jgi:hypothetical protein
MNDEARTTNDEGMMFSAYRPFVIRASSLIRHSSFVIRHFSYA